MDDFEDCQLLEHPMATIRRLKALGVWPEADRLLRKVKQRFRRQATKVDGGTTMTQRLQMTKAAWAAVHERWPPPPGTLPLESLASYLRSTRRNRHSDAIRTRALPLAAERRFDEIGQTTNHVDEVIWVYHRLDDEHVGPLDAPSRGAWSMLIHARMNKDRFYEKVYLPVIRDISRRKKPPPPPRGFRNGNRLTSRRSRKYCGRPWLRVRKWWCEVRPTLAI